MAVSVIGAIIDPSVVEDAVTATIEVWIDSYLTEVENQRGLTVNTISRPLSYNETFDYDNWPEGQLPGIAVISPGTVGEPERWGNGDISAWFEVQVAAIVTGQQEGEVRRVAQRYQSALGALLMQLANLSGATNTPFATDVTFDGYEMRLPDVDNRTLAVGLVNVHVLVDSLFNAQAGLKVAPPPNPIPQVGPPVTRTGFTVDAEPLT
jgi:hypothetical protein